MAWMGWKSWTILAVGLIAFGGLCGYSVMTVTDQSDRTAVHSYFELPWQDDRFRGFLPRRQDARFTIDTWTWYGLWRTRSGGFISYANVE